MPLLGISTSLGATVSTSLGAPSAPAAPATPSAPAVPSIASGPARDFGMTTGETVYLNVRLGGPPTAWVAYIVAYIFQDGNAVLIREPDCVAYTGDMAIGVNLRRKGVDYGDGIFGP